MMVRRNAQRIGGNDEGCILVFVVRPVLLVRVTIAVPSVLVYE